MKKEDQIKHAALTLFSQYGWLRTSVEDICRQANISRVTFYKYFPNKKQLLQQLFLEQKNDMKAGFEALLTENSIEQIMRHIFTLQKQAMQTMYSAPMLIDLQQHKDEELSRFFAEMEREKHQFMHDFFRQLQEKQLIQPQLPILLIDLFIRKIDEIVQDSAVIEHYRNNEPQLFRDVLSMFAYGLAQRTE